MVLSSTLHKIDWSAFLILPSMLWSRNEPQHDWLPCIYDHKDDYDHIFVQVEMVEETEYDEEITCDHSYNKRWVCKAVYWNMSSSVNSCHMTIYDIRPGWCLIFTTCTNLDFFKMLHKLQNYLWGPTGGRVWWEFQVRIFLFNIYKYHSFYTF